VNVDGKKTKWNLKNNLIKILHQILLKRKLIGMSEKNYKLHNEMLNAWNIISNHLSYCLNKR